MESSIDEKKIYPWFDNDIAMLVIFNQPARNALHGLLSFVQFILEFVVEDIDTEGLAYTHPEPFLVRIYSEIKENFSVKFN